MDDAAGQVKLDKTIVDIIGRIPPDLDAINPAVNDAYAAKLAQLGASYLATCLMGRLNPAPKPALLRLFLQIKIKLRIGI